MKMFRNFLALLTAASIAFSLAACSKEEEAITTAPTETEVIFTEEETVAESTTQAVTEPYTQQETTQTVTQDSTAQATKPAETKPQATQVPTTQEQTTKPVTAPSSKADIVNLYNTAVNGASTSKPGYSKTVNTVMSNVNMGALSKISIVKDVVGDFLGEGKTSSTVKKGSFDGKSLVKSTLKESDVTAATCKLSSDKKYYTVEITVKNETNPLKKSSALGKFTKDYKDIDEIKAGINEADAKIDSITIKTSGVKITAKIAVDSNRLVSVSHTFKMSASLTNVKYSIAKVKNASADLSTTVSYSDFKY